MKNRKKWAALVPLLLLFCCSCQGPDPVRIASERANWQLASRCADGWFGGLTWTPHDQKLVSDSLADWDRALRADEKLLGWPVQGAK